MMWCEIAVQVRFRDTILSGLETKWFGDGGLRCGVSVERFGRRRGLKRVAWFGHVVKDKYVNNEWNSTGDRGGDVMLVMMMFDSVLTMIIKTVTISIIIYNGHNNKQER